MKIEMANVKSKIIGGMKMAGESAKQNVTNNEEELRRRV